MGQAEDVPGDGRFEAIHGFLRGSNLGSSLYIWIERSVLCSPILQGRLKALAAREKILLLVQEG
eukprot:3635201-Pyramimonas_sp.AAC.1